MIGELKAYAEYKDSGLSWLGQMPAHWQTQRSKYLFREADERSVTGTEQRLSMSQRHGLIPTSQVEERRLTSETNVGGKLCEPGDLVLNRLKAHLGVLATAPTPGVVSPDYTVLRPIGNTNHRYFCALYRSPHCGQELRRRAKGIVEGFWRLYTDDFYDIRVPVPPSEEQVAIVRFLDWANGRLERAIRAKRKVIALLMDQKQAIIQRAVTRGTDSTVRLKSSGVPHLGEIPRHWEQRALWTLCKLRMERNPTGLPLLSVFLNRGVIRYEDGGGQVHAPSLNLANYQVVRPGDFVLNNQQAWRGSVGVSAHHGIISPAYFVLRLSGELDSGYANHLMRSRVMVDQFVTSSKGVGDIQRSVYWPFLRMVQVPLPPMEEQRSIVRFVEEATSGLGASVDRLDREIKLLHEYRTRIVADIVTGRLDVRAASAQLLSDADTDLHAANATGDLKAIDEEPAEA